MFPKLESNSFCVVYALADFVVVGGSYLGRRAGITFGLTTIAGNDEAHPLGICPEEAAGVPDCHGARGPPTACCDLGVHALAIGCSGHKCTGWVCGVVGGIFPPGHVPVGIVRTT